MMEKSATFYISVKSVKIHVYRVLIHPILIFQMRIDLKRLVDFQSM